MIAWYGHHDKVPGQTGKSGLKINGVTWSGAGTVTTQLQCKSGRTEGKRLILNAALRKVGQPPLSVLPAVSLTASRLAEASQTALSARAGLGHWQLSKLSQARGAKLACLTDNGELYRTSAFYGERKAYLAFQK